MNVMLADSITHVPYASGSNLVVVCGSHGGLSSGICALKRGIKGAIFNDAGLGKDQAGIAGLYLLDKYGVMAAAVDAFFARIGIAAETEIGIISSVNQIAQKAGVKVGINARDAAQIMGKNETSPTLDLICPPKTGPRDELEYGLRISMGR